MKSINTFLSDPVVFFSQLYNRLIYRNMLRRKLLSCGENFRLGYASELLNPEYFDIGKYFFTGPRNYLVTNENNLVEIGDYVMFGPDVKIIGGNHNFKYTENHLYFEKNINHMKEKIIIENGVWIGTQCVILSKAHICEGAVIGAMSLINGYIPPYCIAVGSPAKHFRRRFDTVLELEELLQNINSKYTFDEINSIYQKYNINYTGV